MVAPADYSFATARDWITLQELDPRGLARRVYRFTLEPRSLASFDSQSTRLQTDPTLKWIQAPVVTRLLGNGADRVTLLVDRVRVRQDGVWDEQLIGPDEWEPTLREWFGPTIF